MSQNQIKSKSPVDHIDVILNARHVLSFVGEAIGMSREMEPYSESAHSGVFFILERVKDDLKDAGEALSDAICRNNSNGKTSTACFGCVTGDEARVQN